MRSHRRRTPLQHVLLAGCADDLVVLQSVLAMLPSDVYGQVVVEIEPDVALPELDTPARVTVHRVWPGAADRAVAAWIAEWMPSEPDAARTVGLWISAGSSACAVPLELDVVAQTI
ncbi:MULTISPECIES: hypothetical protein [unclassified Aeromicrobium]|uniref:hypothetical protein n=1 Tax=unclassified Aeromicrobium TaxID=2633570 RepID=UPI0006FF54EC|nr:MULTISPECIES: hypothetical protein [unclassified Aeromicrobium]KQO36645.1 hypothetical protein ASF05_10925 [Aeromicrobium sp. Leaf245]KQP27007.1 hypothetical protein ASF38_08700 [Aeromicrobium sp. Leaf272]KQP78146.1 hypothetical protein ASF37_05975 [Aeromicrobium sp. Leaf289]